MKKKIIIENLEIKASIGVYEKEKKTKQKIIINFEILLKKCNSPVFDQLKEVTDYGQFRKIVLDAVKKKHFNLIETLADEIHKKFLKIETVDKISISITKPGAFKDCMVSFELSDF